MAEDNSPQRPISCRVYSLRLLAEPGEITGYNFATENLRKILTGDGAPGEALGLIGVELTSVSMQLCLVPQGKEDSVWTSVKRDNITLLFLEPVTEEDTAIVIEFFTRKGVTITAHEFGG